MCCRSILNNAMAWFASVEISGVFTMLYDEYREGSCPYWMLSLTDSSGCTRLSRVATCRQIESCYLSDCIIDQDGIRLDRLFGVYCSRTIQTIKERHLGTFLEPSFTHDESHNDDNHSTWCNVAQLPAAH